MTDENENSNERESKKNKKTTHEQLSKKEYQTYGAEEGFSRIFIRIKDEKNLIFDTGQTLSEV